MPVTSAGIQVWRNGASITAMPNPVPVSDGDLGTALISWVAPNADRIEVHVGSPTGPAVLGIRQPGLGDDRSVGRRRNYILPAGREWRGDRERC